MIVYSSIYGGYTTPKPPRPHPHVSGWYLFTDNLKVYAPGWTVIAEPRETFGHRRLQAKYRKCHPPFFHGKEEETLYLDGSIRLFDPLLIDAALEALEESDWALYRHPERANIFEEAEESKRMLKYKGLPIDAQVESYSKEVDLSLKLWAGGIIARRLSHNVCNAGAAWFEECRKWTYQDQLSLPVVLHRFGIEPAELTLGGSIWNNPHFSVEMTPEKP